MAIIIEAPNDVYSIQNNRNTKLFLAGGITNCPDWQSEIIQKLKDVPDLTVYNPRRKNFPIEDPNASEAQITWEYNKLKESDIILFWFSRGSLNPIVLYELGRWGNSSMKKSIVVGLDREYERKQDVIIQTRLSRGNIPFVDSIDEAVYSIKEILKPYDSDIF
jgi:hypothetical protein